MAEGIIGEGVVALWVSANCAQGCLIRIPNALTTIYSSVYRNSDCIHTRMITFYEISIGFMEYKYLTPL